MPEPKAVRADQNNVEPINIVVQADERFAPYLASMLMSLLEKNRTHKLNVFLLVPFDQLDGTFANIKLLSPSLNLQLLSINKEKVRDLPCIPHVGPATYYKLFLGDLLPNDVVRAIYLDCDMLVRADIGDLWMQNLGECVIGAVRDEYVNRADQSSTKLKIGLPVETLYFNAGLILIDVRRWREAGVGDEALRFARNYPDRITYSEQCALNWVLRDKWRPLQDYWNVQTHKVTSFTWGFMHHNKNQLRTAQKAKIIHFTGPEKPWHYMNDHPLKHEYLSYLAKISSNNRYEDFSFRNFIRKNLFRYAPFLLWLKYGMPKRSSD